jgi:hypothetical protein
VRFRDTKIKPRLVNIFVPLSTYFLCFFNNAVVLKNSPRSLYRTVIRADLCVPRTLEVEGKKIFGTGEE